jgi:MoaA/NifB/PqqE/SkfB family radical SAM enzyme
MLQKIAIHVGVVVGIISGVITIFAFASDAGIKEVLSGNIHMRYILAIILCITAVYFVVSWYIKNKYYRGVFAVSALVFYKRDKLLLIKSGKKNQNNEDFFVQPSEPYRKYFDKKYDDSNNLEKPFSKIFKFLTKADALNISVHSLNPISSIPLVFESIDNQRLDGFFARNKNELNHDERQDVENIAPSYRDNEISISPTLTIIEKNPDTLNPKSEPYRIDFYYAFHLNVKGKDIVEKIDQGLCKFVSRDELAQLANNNQTHGDLLAIYDVLQYAINASKAYPTTKLRTCTFSGNKKTAYWRITENCNCKCSYCFNSMKDNKKQSGFTNVGDDIIKKVISHITDNEIEKLIITGGEPLLVSNLFGILEEISKAGLSGVKVSVCTNGLVDFQDFERLNQLGVFEKFVVSVDGYDQRTFSKYKKTLKNDTNSLNKLVSFIKKSKEHRVNVTVNTILTEELMNDTDKYIYFFKNILEIEELSISAVVNNGSNRSMQGIVCKIEQILDFYNDIINGKLKDFNFLNTLDFIVPSCGHFRNVDICPSNKTVFFISPNGSSFGHCDEYIQHFQAKQEVPPNGQD